MMNLILKKKTIEEYRLFYDFSNQNFNLYYKETQYLHRMILFLTTEEEVILQRIQMCVPPAKMGTSWMRIVFVNNVQLVVSYVKTKFVLHVKSDML